MALQAHDRRTRGHAERVRVFTDLLGEELQLSEGDRYRLRWAALMHDIGKLTISPQILNKPGVAGRARMAADEGPPGRRAPGSPSRSCRWLGPWGQAIVEHHERFDGKGYPNGVGGDAISLGGRIVSVSDAYDTMTAARSYKKPMAVWAARRELADCAGGQFDPEIVRAFLSISLPKLLWRTGPVSLAVQLPFLARLQEVGLQSVTAMTQGVAAATVAAGVTAMVVAGPIGASAHGHHARASARGTGTTDVVAAPSATETQPGPGESSPAPGVPTPEPPAPSPGPGVPPEDPSPTPGPDHAGARPDGARTARAHADVHPDAAPVAHAAPDAHPLPIPLPTEIPLPLPERTPLPDPGRAPAPIPALPPLPLPSLPPLPRPSLPPLPIPRPLALLPVETLDIED